MVITPILKFQSQKKVSKGAEKIEGIESIYFKQVHLWQLSVCFFALPCGKLTFAKVYPASTEHHLIYGLFWSISGLFYQR